MLEKIKRNIQSRYTKAAVNLISLFVLGTKRNIVFERFIDAFLVSFKEQPIETLRIIIYLRDARVGLGRDEVFNEYLMWIIKEGNLEDEQLKYFIRAIVTFGGWFDIRPLLTLENDAPNSILISAVAYQIKLDLRAIENNLRVSNLVEYLPTPNPVGERDIYLIDTLISRKYLDLTRNEYEELLKTLAEAHFPDRQPEDVIGSTRTFLKAFSRKQEKIEKIIQRESNHPYNILIEGGMIKKKNRKRVSFELPKYSQEIQNKWNAVDIGKHSDGDIIAIIDTSGSMKSPMIEVAISAAIYFASKNENIFYNTFMSFSSKPRFLSLPVGSLQEKVESIYSLNEGPLDIESAMSSILKVTASGLMYGSKPPAAVLIITDSKLDQVQARITQDDFLESVSKSYKELNVAPPKVICINLSSKDKVPVIIERNGIFIQIFWGMSDRVLGELSEMVNEDPYETLLSVVTHERYLLELDKP